MVDVQSTINSVFPEVKVYGSWIFSTITWIIFIIFFVIVASVITYLIIRLRIYRNKIILFEKINGRWVDTGKDRARELKFGDLGFTILYCMGHKKYLPKPPHQSGIRKFYYKIRGDGNWENFELKDDETPSKLSMFSVEKNITERNVGIRKGIESRYTKSNWLRENAVMLISIGFIALIGIFTYLYLDKWITLVQQTGAGFNAMLDKMNTMMDRLDSLLAQYNSLTAGGSGFKPVT